jgi:hypothetical protein
MRLSSIRISRNNPMEEIQRNSYIQRDSYIPETKTKMRVNIDGDIKSYTRNSPPKTYLEKNPRSSIKSITRREVSRSVIIGPQRHISTSVYKVDNSERSVNNMDNFDQRRSFHMDNSKIAKITRYSALPNNSRISRISTRNLPSEVENFERARTNSRVSRISRISRVSLGRGETLTDFEPFVSKITTIRRVGDQEIERGNSRVSRISRVSRNFDAEDNINFGRSSNLRYSRNLNNNEHLLRSSMRISRNLNIENDNVCRSKITVKNYDGIDDDLRGSIRKSVYVHLPKVVNQSIIHTNNVLDERPIGILKNNNRFNSVFTNNNQIESKIISNNLNGSRVGRSFNYNTTKENYGTSHYSRFY